MCKLKEDENASKRVNILTISNICTYYIHLPIQHSLQQVLQINGLLEATLAYMRELQLEETTISNFIQGSLWKSITQKLVREDVIYLPIVIFFDDVETGNGMGARAGNNSVGCVYTLLKII